MNVYHEWMRTLGWLFVGLGTVCGVAALSLDIEGVLEVVRALVLGGFACLAIAAPAFVVDAHGPNRVMKNDPVGRG